jgi:hypothetical protein
MVCINKFDLNLENSNKISFIVRRTALNLLEKFLTNLRW